MKASVILSTIWLLFILGLIIAIAFNNPMWLLEIVLSAVVLAISIASIATILSRWMGVDDE